MQCWFRINHCRPGSTSSLRGVFIWNKKVATKGSGGTLHCPSAPSPNRAAKTRPCGIQSYFGFVFEVEPFVRLKVLGCHSKLYWFRTSSFSLIGSSFLSLLLSILNWGWIIKDFLLIEPALSKFAYFMQIWTWHFAINLGWKIEWHALLQSSSPRIPGTGVSLI